MSNKSELLALIGEIRASRSVLNRIREFYDSRFADDIRGAPSVIASMRS